jgi:hypothetical protein
MKEEIDVLIKGFLLGLLTIGLFGIVIGPFMSAGVVFIAVAVTAYALINLFGRKHE